MNRTTLPMRLSFLNAPEGGGEGTQGGSGGGPGATKAPEGGQQAKASERPAEGSTKDDGKGGKDAVLADLAKERDKRQELEKQIASLQTTTEQQRDAFAKALGLKPEETSDTDKLAEQLKTLTEQFSTAQRKATLLEVAAEPGMDAEGNKLPAIPKEYYHLLTATETEALQEQAKSIASLLAANGAAAQAPGFVAGNGQGQGDGKTPTLAQQIATAETELAKHARTSPEWRAANEKVLQLKSQQLYALHQKTN